MGVYFSLPNIPYGIITRLPGSVFWAILLDREKKLTNEVWNIEFGDRGQRSALAFDEVHP